jgi:hypothetical protein
MIGSISSWILAALVALPLGYVLPGERVLLELSNRRLKSTPLRVETELLGGADHWPRRVMFELHPDLGFRVSEPGGGRWLVRGGRVVASSAPTPPWIPALEILVLRQEEDLQAWMRWAGVPYDVNQLGRCGEMDCFVIGGRDGHRQLWIDKDRFEVLRWVAGPESAIEFSHYRNWEEIRFPSEIRIVDRDSEFAVFLLEQVSTAPELGAADFTPVWVDKPTDY